MKMISKHLSLSGISNKGLLFLGFVIFLSSCELTWLYFQTVAVSPQKHFEYTKVLRDFREADAQINGEVLANRLEITRNYDRLLRFIDMAQGAASSVEVVPSFVFGMERNSIVEKARELQQIQKKKFQVIEIFQRNNAILRNSLTYFPVATNEFLNNESLSVANKSTLENYTRQVLSYVHSPISEHRLQVDIAREKLSVLNTDLKNEHINNLLIHGDIVVTYLPEVNNIIQEIMAFNITGHLEAINLFYTKGYAQAENTSVQYRKLLFMLALLLTAYLAFVFIRLERARQSLAKAHEEISQRYAAQLLAEDQLRLHATVFHSSHDGMILSDAEGNILDVNPAFTRVSGYERSELIGQNPRLIKSGHHEQDFYAAMWKSILVNGNWRGEIWNRNKFGEVYPELLSVSSVHNAHGDLTNFVAVYADIRQLKEQEKQLTRLAYFDALTGLPNRVVLADILTQEMFKTRRSGNIFAVCFLDLDGFKQVNDTYGHEIGDQILVEMAVRLKENVQGGDTVARFGGDEFVLLLHDLNTTLECDQAIQRILKFVEQPLLVISEPIMLAASIGVTLFPNDDADPETLIRHADQAMYQAKQAGRNRYHLFDYEFDRNIRMCHERLERIEQALVNQEFTLYYQPKVNMREGKVTGAEALIRWLHPERGVIAPGEFLPFIENHNLSVRIGEWVIETALNQLDEWLHRDLNITVNINVDGYHLQNPGFVKYLSSQLVTRPHLAKNIELEILETSALDDIAKVSRIIDECIELGVCFALDDFGTGYSSLTYLKRLPISTIKIDQSFVREMTSEPNSLIIVQGILGLSSAFQRQVIAEGVESIEHGRLLMQLNCDHAQGYGIARPMSAENFPEWLANWLPHQEWVAIKNVIWESVDSSIFVARVELINWVSQLIYSVNDGKPVLHKDSDDDQKCNFGIWYYGLGGIKYKHLACFEEIEHPYLRLHEIADQIDLSWRNRQHDQAKNLINELLNQRNLIIEILVVLEKMVAVGI